MRDAPLPELRVHNRHPGLHRWRKRAGDPTQPTPNRSLNPPVAPNPATTPMDSNVAMQWPLPKGLFSVPCPYRQTARFHRHRWLAGCVAQSPRAQPAPKPHQRRKRAGDLTQPTPKRSLKPRQSRPIQSAQPARWLQALPRPTPTGLRLVDNGASRHRSPSGGASIMPLSPAANSHANKSKVSSPSRQPHLTGALNIAADHRTRLARKPWTWDSPTPR